MLIEKTIDGRITPFLIDQLCLASNLSFEKEIRTGHHHHWQTSIQVHFRSNLFDYRVFIYIYLLLVVDRHKLTVFYLKSFDKDSVQVGKAVFGKEIHTTLGIEPRTILQSGEVRQPL